MVFGGLRWEPEVRRIRTRRVRLAEEVSSGGYDQDERGGRQLRRIRIDMPSVHCYAHL